MDIGDHGGVTSGGRVHEGGLSRAFRRSARVGRGAKPWSTDGLRRASRVDPSGPLLDQRIRQTQSELAHNPPRSLGHVAIDGNLSKRREQLTGKRSGRVACEQLGSADHRVVEPVPPRTKLGCTPQVVDEHVGVDENVSHVANCPGWGRQQMAPHRTWQPGPLPGRARRRRTRRSHAESPQHRRPGHLRGSHRPAPPGPLARRPRRPGRRGRIRSLRHQQHRPVPTLERGPHDPGAPG